MTCWRRLRDWQDAGLWDKIHRHMLDRLNLAGQINWSRASVEAPSNTGKTQKVLRPLRAAKGAAVAFLAIS